MPRISLSGPRMLGGLVRPGISFSTRELAATSKHAPKPDPTAVIAIAKRSDGGIVIESPSHQGVDMDDGTTPVCMFNCINKSEADEIRAGALARLAKHIGADGWLTGLSIGKVVSACRAEITAMGFTTVFTYITPAMLAKAQDGTNAENPRKSNPVLWPFIITFFVLWAAFCVLSVHLAS